MRLAFSFSIILIIALVAVFVSFVIGAAAGVLGHMFYVKNRDTKAAEAKAANNEII
ncbi:MAG: hypothetical protein IIY18_00270 [Clostridia bacterium]|nr:hypothetical protein [Clostridia bacterium]MBQ5598183.1 hypothetical protein [Clostridia bacterium]